MARLTGEAPLAPLAISAASTYWLWQVAAPANQRVLISAYFCAQDYNTNGTPGLLGFYRCSAIGTGGSSATIAPLEEECAETFQTAIKTNVPNGTPPTTTTLIREIYINPQVSVPEYFPLHEEIVIKGGGILAVKYQPQASGNVAGWLRIQE